MPGTHAQRFLRRYEDAPEPYTESRYSHPSGGYRSSLSRIPRLSQRLLHQSRYDVPQRLVWRLRFSDAIEVGQRAGEAVGARATMVLRVRRNACIVGPMLS